jgi:hypothetical protein
MRPKCLGLFAILGIVMGSAVAKAADVVYPGTTCRPESPATGGIYETNWGSVLNASSTSDLNVVCPIVRTSTFSGGIGANSTITFLDRNLTLNVSCDLRSESFSNGSPNHNNTSGPYTSAASGSPVQVTKFISVSPSGGEYYYLFCNIPRTDNGAKSGIVSYRISEF